MFGVFQGAYDTALGVKTLPNQKGSLASVVVFTKDTKPNGNSAPVWPSEPCDHLLLQSAIMAGKRQP